MEITVEKQIENVIKWIEGLQSGNYKQETRCMGNMKEGVCCWGLGCYLVGISFTPDEGWNTTFHSTIGFKDTQGTITNVTYQELESISGLSSFSTDRLAEAVGNINLATLNDDFYFTFPQIAEVLIKHRDKAFIPEVAEAIGKHFIKP